MSFKETYLFESGIASLFAQYKHRDQVRKFDGQPYYVHPKEVAQIVWKATKDMDMVRASYLHDTLEDTDTTFEELKEKFGQRVADLAKELTSDTDLIKTMGKTPYLIKKMNAMSKDALTIKLADRISNVGDFNTAPDKFKNKYGPATRDILDGLKTKDPLHLKLINRIEEVITKHGF
jgi:(p)ppGpp synthase/HD superfamily hydrolase